MKFDLIVATDMNGAIGKENTLPWKVSKDMKWFKSNTINSVVVMGRKTFESHGCRVLPNRINVVIGKSVEYTGYDIKQYVNITEFLDNIDTDIPNCEHAYIIGGSQMYSHVLDHWDHLVNSILLTKMDFEVEDADVFFPTIPDQYTAQELMTVPDVEKINNTPITLTFLKYTKTL